jgi:4-deoxy-L-threo-5-hexosulose-uronate ketol-isomerase
MDTRNFIIKEQLGPMDTAALRQHFVFDLLFIDDATKFVITGSDDVIIGGAKPLDRKLQLENDPALGSEYFLEKREMGIINVGGEGIISADGVIFNMAYLSCTYLGLGTTDVSFLSVDPASPALFYIVSTPCTHAFPNRQITQEEITPVDLAITGHDELPLEYKYIYENGTSSCNLLMGVTIVKNGNLLNDIETVSHENCTRVYFYFDMEESFVTHSIGEAAEITSLPIKNYEAIISPPGNVSRCCHPGNYAFVWAIAAENQPIANTLDSQVK